MKKEYRRIVFKIIKIICIILACGGMFCLLGFIGNVDHCTELGIESEVGLPHLLISTAVFMTGVISYKIAAKLGEMI